MMKNSIFDFDHSGETLILIPNTDLRELEFDTLEAGSAKVFEALNSETITNVIIDFHKTDYYGYTALAVFCNVSSHEQEILELTNLISLWAVCPTRQDAIDLVQAN